ncbi:hypothetical protein [Pseudomonas chlororaphis]
MVTHYSIGANQVACGRNNHNVNANKTTVGVTCKTCRFTTIYRDAEAASANGSCTAGSKDPEPMANQIDQEQKYIDAMMRLPSGETPSEGTGQGVVERYGAYLSMAGHLAITKIQAGDTNTTLEHLVTLTEMKNRRVRFLPRQVIKRAVREFKQLGSHNGNSEATSVPADVSMAADR